MNLYKHQKEAKDFVLKRGGCAALFMDVGTGKTLTALSIYRHYRQKNPDLKLVIVCPLSLVYQAWTRDINQFTHYRSAYHKHYVNEQILIINPEALIRHQNYGFIHDNFKGAMCVIDESTRMRSNTSQFTKKMLYLADIFKYRVVMSANPTPNSEMEIWGQLNFVRSGHMGDNFYQFRNYFFELVRGKQRVQVVPSMISDFLKKGFKFDMIAAHSPKFYSRVKELSFYKKKHECLDLPAQVDEYRSVFLGPNERRVYRDMQKKLIAEFNNQVIVSKTALVKIMKLRQITSGFAYNEEGTVALKDESKLRELKVVLEELGENQAIIWINFVCEQEKIMQLLGEKAVKASEEGFDLFRDGKRQYLVLNPKSCAHGLTFVNCSYQIFFSLSYSYEEYQQAKGRIHRIGQKNKCTYIHLLADGTIDDIVLQAVRDKADVEVKLHQHLRRGK